jgi:hypothetical protein
MRYGLDLGGKKMDAVEFLRARRKLCDDNVCGESCPLFYCCDDDSEDNRIRQVLAVEKWAKEHPVKTRQSEFLKQYPEAEIGDDGLPGVDPCQLYKEIANVEIYDGYCNKYGCTDCRRDFWLAEIKDGEA